jgi:hypothetical protein
MGLCVRYIGRLMSDIRDTMEPRFKDTVSSSIRPRSGNLCTLTHRCGKHQQMQRFTAGEKALSSAMVLFHKALHKHSRAEGY